MANRNGQQVVYVERRRGNGCLVTAVAFLLFGWLGVAAVALWKLLGLAWRATWAIVRASWAVFVAYPVKWSIIACVWLGRGAVAAYPGVRDGTLALHKRYGWRLWAVVGGVVLVLAILGAIVR